jgi:superfamily II DNA/RNA helicase
LDEGDKMLDIGFEQDIEETQKNLPQETRSMIFLQLCQPLSKS